MSGAARVGKSTILQAITGLGNEQIPAGRGLPVTAVRSQIFNDPGRREAIITFFEWNRFLTEVLGPLHAQLALPTTPRTIDEWRQVDYERVRVDQESGEARADLRRCLEMQQAIDSFQDYFDKPISTFPLDAVSKFVSYPPDVNSSDRPYVAVSSVVIYCPFPRVDAARLGLIDLPGLGEIAPRAEERHSTALATEVDVVVMVKRPDDQSSYWSRSDGRAYQLIQGARGAISNADDFCSIALNTGSVDEELRRALLDSITSDAPQVPRYEADGADEQSVRGQLLLPVLERLADRLPVMDEEVLNAARQQSAAAAQSLLATVQTLTRSLTAPILVGSAAQHLDELTESTTLEIAHELKALEAELLERAKKAEDESFIDEVVRCYEGARRWIDEEAFSDDSFDLLLKRMERGAGSGSTLETELNRVRVEISEYSPTSTTISTTRFGSWPVASGSSSRAGFMDSSARTTTRSTTSAAWRTSWRKATNRRSTSRRHSVSSPTLPSRIEPAFIPK